jgi:hypothetical protein
MLKVEANADRMLDQGDRVLLVFLDLGTAIDTMDREIMLTRLRNMVAMQDNARECMEANLFLIRGTYQRVIIKTQLEMGVLRSRTPAPHM